MTLPARRTFLSPYRRGIFWKPWVSATCISAVALIGKVASLMIPSGGFTGSLARDLVKSIPEPMAAAMEPVTGSHFY